MNAKSNSETSTAKIKELAERMIANANNESVKFPKSKVNVCHSCKGTTMRYVYQYGKRLATRCEGAIWDKEKRRFICLGNPDAEKLEQANRKDLLNQIWKIVMFLKQKQSFLAWLQHEFKTESISSFSLQKLELILNKVKAQTIFANQQSLSQEITSKAA
ncbi:MAG: hypothetical protein WAQ98_23375 [Blastocatellia bacterium]